MHNTSSRRGLSPSKAQEPANMLERFAIGFWSHYLNGGLLFFLTFITDGRDTSVGNPKLCHMQSHET